MCYTEISDQMFFNKHLKMWGEAAEWERHSPMGQEGSSPGREENRRGQLSTIERREGGDRLPIMATLRTVQWLPLSLQGRPAPSLPVCRNHKALQVRPCCPSHLPSWLAALPLCCSHAGLIVTLDHEGPFAPQSLCSRCSLCLECSSPSCPQRCH